MTCVRQKLFFSLLLCAVVFSFFPKNGHAYEIPASGSADVSPGSLWSISGLIERIANTVQKDPRLDTGVIASGSTQTLGPKPLSVLGAFLSVGLLVKELSGMTIDFIGNVLSVIIEMIRVAQRTIR